MAKKRTKKPATCGYVVNRDVFIQIPPDLPTFYLPPTSEIAKLKVGDTVKMIFVDPNGENGERMWVEITHQLDSHPIEWVGRLDNVPVRLDAQFNDVVRFAPTAIINIFEKEEKEDS
jgi:hypothetical protein